MAATASDTWVFWACLFQGPAEYLGFHSLAAEEAFEFAYFRLEFAGAACRDNVLVSPDRLLPTLGHAPPPLEQQLGETPWSRATAETVIPGCMVCSTSRTFSSPV